MNGFRRLAANHRSLAAMILAMALVIRILVPAGFMPVLERGGIAIVHCSGIAPPPAMAIPAMTHHETNDMAHVGMGPQAPADADRHEGSGIDAPCAFAGSTMPALPGAYSLVLAAALVFLMLLAAQVPARPSLGAALRLRPPLRGPPAFS
ncbi:hypothetical protein RZN05_07735 [Sphingomonas sp. HF-S4]|uniref:DUF2946 domain-containing protein n=1 Tax=Sphingomonas agrestis TaxID=3080540 RepID=A0ABU3Y6E5_9SPHN|nr:hypothetical protein [Sphingomonas sp. HF-S4]MDV3456869.1 hypothetical protein [Sphingomonas sp. HF-S4]